MTRLSKAELQLPKLEQHSLLKQRNPVEAARFLHLNYSAIRAEREAAEAAASTPPKGQNDA